MSTSLSFRSPSTECADVYNPAHLAIAARQCELSLQLFVVSHMYARYKCIGSMGLWPCVGSWASLDMGYLLGGVQAKCSSVCAQPCIVLDGVVGFDLCCFQVFCLNGVILYDLI